MSLGFLVDQLKVVTRAKQRNGRVSFLMNGWLPSPNQPLPGERNNGNRWPHLRKG